MKRIYGFYLNNTHSRCHNSSCRRSLKGCPLVFCRLFLFLISPTIRNPVCPPKRKKRRNLTSAETTMDKKTTTVEKGKFEIEEVKKITFDIVLVKWKNCDKTTTEPLKVILQDAPEAIVDFLRVKRIYQNISNPICIVGKSWCINTLFCDGSASFIPITQMVDTKKNKNFLKWTKEVKSCFAVCYEDFTISFIPVSDFDEDNDDLPMLS